MRKGLIFDFDGTLVDSETHWAPIGCKLLEEATGKPWTPQEQGQFVGLGLAEQHQILCEQHGMTHSLKSYQALTHKHCMVVYDSLSQLNPGARELFVRLEEMDIPFTIASAGHRAWITAALRRLEIDRYFDEICTADDVERTKPHPDVYLLAAEKIGVKPEDCIGIEDTHTGLKAVHAANMTSIAYHTAHNTEHDLSFAHIKIHDFAELTHERLALLLR